jgi:ABC-2 type transport system ATP-binding protein
VVRPTRGSVRCPDPVRLAGALAADGLVEIDTLPDGRLAVGDADAARVGDVALAAGVAVHGLVEERRDLEQMFLHLVAGSPPTIASPYPGAVRACAGRS